MRLEKAKCLFFFFFHYCCLYLNRGTAKPDTRTEQLIPMDYNKHISQKKTRVQGKTKSSMLIFVFVVIAFEYCFQLFFSFFFNFMNKSIHIYIPLYFCLLFVILVLYMNPFRHVFFL